MLTFLIRSATSQSNSYPIVLVRLGGPRSPNPHLKFVEVPGIEPATSWLVRHANPYLFDILLNYLTRLQHLSCLNTTIFKLVI